MGKKNTHKKFLRSFSVFFILTILLPFYACHQKKQAISLYTDTLDFEHTKPSSNQSIENTPTDENSIFYGIYSPAKVSAIFKRKHIIYNPDILSPTDNIPAFNTKVQIAINLGIYGADLSYTQLFQSGDAVKYLNVILELSGQLGIPPEYIRNLMKRLDYNISNPDSLIQIGIEAFNRINHFLIEQNQGNTAYLIITGAWIEAMYIAAHDLLKDNNPEIINKIVEQKYSLEYLLSVIKNFYTDTNVAYFYRRLYVLDRYMNKTRIFFQDNVMIDPQNKTIIASGDMISYSEKDIVKIKEIIFSLRSLALSK